MNVFKRGIAKLKLEITLNALKNYEKYMRKYLSSKSKMYFNGSMYAKIMSFKSIASNHNTLMNMEKVIENEK